MATVTYKGFKPYSHQKAVIELLKGARFTSRTVVCKSSRQKGKSSLIANLLLYFAINYKRTKNYGVSPTLKQAKSIYKTIIDAIEESGIIKASNGTDLEITLVNGSLISFKSAEQGETALRGFTADFLAVDECAFIPDNIWYTIMPWCDAKKAPCLMTSTPFIKEGFFWVYYNYGCNNQNNVMTVDWCDEKYREDIEKILPPERLEEYRLMLPARQFKSEYLGEWLDDDGQVFTGFKECKGKFSIGLNDRLYVGIDWGNNTDNDDTVISIINQDGNQVYLDYWNNLNTTEQIDRIYEIIKPYESQIISIQPELNSIGTPYTDLLKERLQVSTRNKVEGFQTTNKSKADLVTELQVAFEQRMIGLLDDDKQMRELSVYAAEYNPKTKNVSYNAPQGLHDDICIALMLSWNAFKKNKGAGTYKIRYSRNRNIK